MSLLKFFGDARTGLVILSLGEGDLLLESLREVARQADLHTGSIHYGLGSLSRVRTSGVGGRLDLPGPIEIVGFGGVIADFQPHVHITLVDGSGRFYGGHLEEGCAIHTVAEVGIARASELRLVRRVRNGSRVALLDAE